MTPLAVSEYTAVTALGTGCAPTHAALRDGRTGLAPGRFESASLETWLGAVADVDSVRLPAAVARYDCRNNRLAWLALQADGFAEKVAKVRERYGAERVGIFIGTSTSGILQTETAYQHRDAASGALPASFDYGGTHDTYSAVGLLREACDLRGPALAVTTACSSSAKVFGTAARMIELGLIDAAVVGGVDSFCLTTLYGFNSLELLSPEICRPWDANRRGLSLGEGAALVLLERDPVAPRAWLLGVGETSDGHHMSSPLPDGAGAAEAMRMALSQAGLDARQVDYLNLHGTATHGNDAAEDLAVSAVFGPALACSSSKGATGHTLGAAGGVEAVISLLCLQHGLIPGGLNRQTADPGLHCNYVTESREAPLRVVASNSFGFGGSNACLVFGGAA